ncbi:MAG: ABC transporter ATP-binding protein [Gemmatimonadota bacterium]
MTFETHDLVFRYGRGRPPALDGVTLRVPAGSFYAVLGPNGSGKSTLMRALLGAVAPESGRVILDGRELAAWGRRELAKAVGAVTQSESIAFPLTVRQLVEMGRYPHLGPVRGMGRDDLAAVERALEQCDALGFADRDVGTLSGGEFQRARVARALAQEPRALVLDEPTQSLDVRHEMEILSLLRKAAAGGMTIFLITHHLDAASRFADRLLLMEGGRVAAEGSPEEVLREESLERIYHWPMSVRPDPITGHLRVTPLG